MDTHTVWEALRYDDTYLDDAISFNFPIPFQLNEREALNYLKSHLPEDERQWISYANNKWIIDIDFFKTKYNDTINALLNQPEKSRNEPRGENTIYSDLYLDTKLTLDIISGVHFVEPEVTERNQRGETQTTVKFILTYEKLTEMRSKKIFLSHKSANKTIVKEFSETLKIIGYDTWLDDDVLNAGEKLHRGILNGFKNSCAAIFFITPDFVDEKYLATEIDYAITEANEKGDKFKIITLLLKNDKGIGKVPDLLKQFVYKSPKSDLEAIREIVKALPLKPELIG